MNLKELAKMYGNSENYQRVLAMAKEIKEETDIKKVASLVLTKEWIVIFSTNNSVTNETTFCLIRI